MRGIRGIPIFCRVLSLMRSFPVFFHLQGCVLPKNGHCQIFFSVNKKCHFFYFHLTSLVNNSLNIRVVTAIKVYWHWNCWYNDLQNFRGFIRIGSVPSTLESTVIGHWSNQSRRQILNPGNCRTPLKIDRSLGEKELWEFFSEDTF